MGRGSSRRGVSDWLVTKDLVGICNSSLSFRWHLDREKKFFHDLRNSPQDDFAGSCPKHRALVLRHMILRQFAERLFHHYEGWLFKVHDSDVLPASTILRSK